MIDGGASVVNDHAKSFSARRINAACHTPGIAVWQRNYYERVIRDEAELNQFCDYILLNPVKWEEDRYHADSPIN